MSESKTTLSPNDLAFIRAQEYPTVIDDNGRPWYINQIQKMQTEIDGLRAEMDKTKVAAYAKGYDDGVLDYVRAENAGK